MKINLLFTNIICVVILQCMPGNQASLNTTEQNLLSYIFENYSSVVRPVINRKTVTNITFSFRLVQITTVEDKNQMIDLRGSTIMLWRNELLQWNASEWDGIDLLKINPSSMWIPDIMLWGRVDKNFGEDIPDCKKLVYLFNNGTVYWSCEAIFKVGCDLDVTYFPFDRQECKLKYASWALDQTEIILKHDNLPVVSKGYMSSGEWDIINIKATEESFPFLVLPNAFSSIVFTLKIQRKPLYYTFNVVIPCVMLMVIILVGFFLPPESGERISLVITVLLAFTVYLQLMASSLPTTSDTTPVISTFYIAIMAEGVFSLIITCIVLLIHHHGESVVAKPVPSWARKFFIEFIGSKCGFSNKIVSHESSLHKLHVLHSNGTNRHIESNMDGIKANGPSHDNNLKSRISSAKELQGDMMGRSAVDESLILQELLKEVNIISSMVHEKHKEDDIMGEWKMLAKVIDQLSFWIMLIIFLVTSLAIFLPGTTNYSPQ